MAESANGVKYLYDINPIKKVGQSVKSDTATTSVGQSVKSDTSTTGDIAAQNQTESQAQIRSSPLSDRDVLRIAAQMAKNSESRSLTDADRARLGIIEQKLGRIDDAEEQRQGFLEEKRAILAGREAKELSDAERAQLRKVQKNLDTVNGKIRRLNEELSQTQEKKVVRALLKKARVVVERDAVQRSVSSYRETRQRAEYMGKLRRSVERNAKRLQEMLLTNTDKKHVPEALKKPVAELLRSMNLISKRGLAGGAMTKADELFHKKGITDIAMVLGYRAEVIQETLKDYEGIRYFYNPFFDVTNSIASAWFAKDFLSQYDDTLIMNADVYLEETLLDRILECHKSPVMFADGTRKEEADYKYKYENGLLVKYGKELTGSDITGEYIGIGRFSKDFMPEFMEKLDGMIRTQQHSVWWENILYEMVGKRPVYVEEMDGLFWAEVDYVEDYERILRFRGYKADFSLNVEKI